MIYSKKPLGFSPKFEVASCFFEHDKKILLLLRQDSKPQGNTWGVPAGKVEKGESAADAICRELYEETGYKADAAALKALHTIFVRYSEYDFVYHIFTLKLTKDYAVLLDPTAHKDFKWVTPDEALEMNLIQDLSDCVKLAYALL